ncbi:3-isopropylmalate dehydratase small subunit [Bacillus canaveralius]|uniref:3-isopropylmalate dehydratase small subunit n=1 Tax=Bacillus canaveralius TaxID=1403243 RepID=A0A2N5GI94_9BACI|nr:MULTISPECIES: 3-isopropylmalate dehydratase small subunit [Bacillus]PLR80677.1 3-isopropylmalate dehydratase small subunit [Bacillus canaveralius]PLR83871.1 3-isopropylmalate dehydratase small subunit [Bacillus sp. V33-4]PLR89094.1 3-isopropylmalate dehydratase small subunit [Bacillus canaveralius]RSK43135.1 3-isopropylmalate dehydratase small subunit [Bacillus canaveralius]
MTQSFLNFTNIVAPLDVVNVDTDAIIPKQFLKRIERTGFGQFLFYDWRFENGKENETFILNHEEYRHAGILLARKNFGCGSSREHAPWALADYGIKVIIAPSFADIFYNNCFKNGILPIELSEEEVEQLFQKTASTRGYQLTIDLENQTLTDKQGFISHFQVAPYRKELLIKGLDEIGASLQFAEKIAAFEKTHKIYYRLDSDAFTKNS